MKKVLALVLMLALAVSMAVPAAAVGSPAADVEDLKPLLLYATSKDYGIFTTDQIHLLSEEKQETFLESWEEAPDAVPEGMAVLYFFYFHTVEPCTASFWAAGYHQETYIQYVNGAWRTLKSTMHKNGTVTVEGVMDGPMAILVSVNDHPDEDSVPFLLYAGSHDYDAVFPADIKELPEALQKIFAEAKLSVMNAAPKGMKLEHFFYFRTEEPCSAVFLVEKHKDIAAMQYVDGQWVELEVTEYDGEIIGVGDSVEYEDEVETVEVQAEHDGVEIIVSGAVDAPMAIFIK